LRLVRKLESRAVKAGVGRVASGSLHDVPRVVFDAFSGPAREWRSITPRQGEPDIVRVYWSKETRDGTLYCEEPPVDASPVAPVGSEVRHELRVGKSEINEFVPVRRASALSSSTSSDAAAPSTSGDGK